MAPTAGPSRPPAITRRSNGIQRRTKSMQYTPFFARGNSMYGNQRMPNDGRRSCTTGTIPTLYSAALNAAVSNPTGHHHHKSTESVSAPSSSTLPAEPFTFQPALGSPFEENFPLSTESILSPPQPQEPKLPHFYPEDVDVAAVIPRISASTLIDLMSSSEEKPLIIDCRFEYEYQGGHIDGAFNFNDKDELVRELFDRRPLPTPGTGNGQFIVLHCEYSAHRAPRMASHLRHADRAANCDNYPKLSFPEVYILDGGYKSFFAQHPAHCFPQNYVAMGAKEHESACEKGLARVKRRTKLGRAQTYAFGQHQMSPCAGMHPPGERAVVPPSPDLPSSSPVQLPPANRPQSSFLQKRLTTAPSPSSASSSSFRLPSLPQSPSACRGAPPSPNSNLHMAQSPCARVQSSLTRLAFV